VYEWARDEESKRVCLTGKYKILEHTENNAVQRGAPCCRDLVPGLKREEEEWNGKRMARGP
jgi:hypothetical protein